MDCDNYDLYQRAHVANAVGIPEHNFIKNPNYSSDPARLSLVASAEDFASLMSRMGIGNDTTVVSYDAGGGTPRRPTVVGAQLLRPHEGQVAQRRLEEVARRRPSHVDGRAETSRRPPSPRQKSPTWSGLMDYGVSCVGDPDTVFLDVRSDDEWSGAGARGNSGPVTCPEPCTWSG